jgi:hypothetical protein
LYKTRKQNRKKKSIENQIGIHKILISKKNKKITRHSSKILHFFTIFLLFKHLLLEEVREEEKKTNIA